MRREMYEANGGGNASGLPRFECYSIDWVATAVERPAARRAGCVSLDRGNLAGAPVDTPEAPPHSPSLAPTKTRSGASSIETSRSGESSSDKTTLVCFSFPVSIRRRDVNNVIRSGVQLSPIRSSPWLWIVLSTRHVPSIRRRSVQFLQCSRWHVITSGYPSCTHKSSAGSGSVSSIRLSVPSLMLESSPASESSQRFPAV